MSHCHRALRAALVKTLAATALAAGFTAAVAGAATRPAAPAMVTQVIGRLPPAMLRVLQGSGLPLASFGVYVQPVNAQQPVATLNAEEPYVLASTAKLVTALAGLELLGPHYRWRTHAFVTGPVEAGVLRGDLIIVGGGDPRFSSRELRAWMQRMRDKGLQRIAGHILVDRSAFALHDVDHKDTPLPLQPRHVRPDALIVDEGLMQVLVHPARGAKAHVATEPPLAGLALVNNVAMRGGCSAWAQWSDGAPPAGKIATAPPKQEPRLVVQGQWGNGCGPKPITLLVPPRVDAAPRAVAGMWADVGGRLDGSVKSVDLAARQPSHQRLPLFGSDGAALLPWATHISETLPQLVREMNKSSNNLSARHLMLSLAKGFPLKAASIEGAQSSLQGWLQRQGLQRGDIVLDNGSGLSRGERGKPRALVQLLLNAWKSPQAKPFLESLPVAGIDGTLAHRMLRGAATGRAFLKTGTLNDARALAGYVQGMSGQFYAVAALVNHVHAARATPSLDAMIEWLAKNG
jgi:D-alanyl-D-alanine carboxypeptidase/D-alanyl-D-alanine-endopeptidase (penicillin-binding protein 4)